MSWREEYKSKCMDAGKALEAVRSGTRVWIQSGCGTPSTLVNALVARSPEVRDVEVVHMMTLGKRRLHQAGVRRPFSPSRIISGRQCSRGSGGGACGLHAHLPQRN